MSNRHCLYIYVYIQTSSRIDIKTPTEECFYIIQLLFGDFLKDLKCLISSESMSGKPFGPQSGGNEDRFLPMYTFFLHNIMCQNSHSLWKYIVFNMQQNQGNQDRFSLNVHRIYASERPFFWDILHIYFLLKFDALDICQGLLLFYMSKFLCGSESPTTTRVGIELPGQLKTVTVK